VLGFGSRDATVYTVDDMVDDMVDSMMERRYRGARGPANCLWPRRSAPDDPPERDGTATSRRACRDGNRAWRVPNAFRSGRWQGPRI